MRYIKSLTALIVAGMLMGCFPVMVSEAAGPTPISVGSGPTRHMLQLG